ncbi:hypothetical protein [Vannielia sp. SX4]|uniref:hypothetical protein n=1 Tax=Vannielia sp. SX4 TaxID=3463852 RepID=UPI00405866E3
MIREFFVSPVSNFKIGTQSHGPVFAGQIDDAIQQLGGKREINLLYGQIQLRRSFEIRLTDIRFWRLSGLIPSAQHSLYFRIQCIAAFGVDRSEWQQSAFVSTAGVVLRIEWCLSRLEPVIRCVMHELQQRA